MKWLVAAILVGFSGALCYATFVIKPEGQVSNKISMKTVNAGGGDFEIHSFCEEGMKFLFIGRYTAVSVVQIIGPDNLPMTCEDRK